MTETSDNPQELITYHYHFSFADRTEKTFTIHLDAQTLDLLPPAHNSLPPWTALSHHQCPNCPLQPADHPHCPIAVNLTDVVDSFRDATSYQQVHLFIHSQSRSYQKDTSLQEGLSALLGIYMVSSGCPIMDRLRPMLRAHIPFSTAQETTYRFLSMYMLAQYFLYRRGKKPDMGLDKLKTLFHDIRLVNKHFWKRFASMKMKDASLNALVVLDNLAQYASFSLDLDMLSETELLFRAYFTD